MKLLILYYSRTGNNRLLAQHLAEKLESDIEEIRAVRKFEMLGFLLDFFKNRQPKIAQITMNPQDYDHVLFLAPFYDMGIAHPMKTAVTQLRTRLGPYSFVSFCGYEREGQAKHVLAELLELTGIAPTHMQELWVGDLLPENERANTIKVSGYKVKEPELVAFTDSISQIVAWYKQAP